LTEPDTAPVDASGVPRVGAPTTGAWLVGVPAAAASDTTRTLLRSKSVSRIFVPSGLTASPGWCDIAVVAVRVDRVESAAPVAEERVVILPLVSATTSVLPSLLTVTPASTPLTA
jgi:hypothetical protein